MDTLPPISDDLARHLPNIGSGIQSIWRRIAGRPKHQASDPMLNQSLMASREPGPVGPGGFATGMPGPSYAAPVPTTDIRSLIATNPTNDYQGLVARLAARAQNRADMYSQIMPQTIKGLPEPYRQAYAASIPDVGMSLSAYSDALANAATTKPQLDQAIANWQASQQAGGAGGGADAFASLIAMLPDSAKKK